MKVTITVHKFPQLKICTNCLIRMKKKKKSKKNHKKQNKKDKIWIKYNVRLYVIHMFEGVDGNKTYESDKWSICNHYYFLEVSFRFQAQLCNDCHNSMQKARSSNDFAIFSIKRNDCRMHFCYICKDKTINFLYNTKLKEKFALFSKHEKFIYLYLKN